MKDQKVRYPITRQKRSLLFIRRRHRLFRQKLVVYQGRIVKVFFVVAFLNVFVFLKACIHSIMLMYFGQWFGVIFICMIYNDTLQQLNLQWSLYIVDIITSLCLCISKVVDHMKLRRLACLSRANSLKIRLRIQVCCRLQQACSRLPMQAY